MEREKGGGACVVTGGSECESEIGSITMHHGIEGSDAFAVAAREAIAKLAIGDITLAKRITSFDNVVFLLWYKASGDCESGSESGSESGVRGSGSSACESVCEREGRKVLRFPRKDPAKRPRQHCPTRQAWVCAKWRAVGVPVAETELVADNYLVEGFIEGQALEGEAVEPVFPQLGHTLALMHSIKTQKFGPFGDTPGIGEFETWDAFLQDFFIKKLAVVKASNVVDVSVVQQLENTYEKYRDYLVSFNNSSLLHGDLCGDNVRVTKTDGEGYKLSGIVDMCDVICGDPLYDFVELLGIGGTWASTRGFQKAYGRVLTRTDKEIISLYAGLICILFMVEDDGSNKMRSTDHVKEYAEKLAAVMESLASGFTDIRMSGGSN